MAERKIKWLTFFCACLTSYANIEVGFGNIKHDTIAGDVVVESGTVPRWLKGSFLRMACGALGETGSDLSIINKLEHLFDCIPVGQSYQFDEGRMTFYQRYYDSAIEDVWRAYDMNMNESRVYWQTVYSPFDYERKQILEPILSHMDKIERMPEVTMWQMGNKIFGHSEYEGLVQIDPHTVENAPHFHSFKDDYFGFTNEIIFDENAHEVPEYDGSVYLTHMVFKFTEGTLKQWKHVFRMTDDVRTTVARIPYPDVDLSLCYSEGEPVVYPVLSHRQGYMHSFAMTENYIIVPEASYVVDLCSLMLVTYRPDKGLYEQYFTWEQEAPSRIWVIRKSDGRIMANLTTEPVFITHQMNAYEEDGFIYADMVTFNNSRPYTNNTRVEQLISTGVDAHDVHRYVIDMSDWSLQRFNLFPGHQYLEFPTINQDYVGRPYTYSWVGVNMYSPAPNALVKVNVKSQRFDERFDFPVGFYMFEPWFVQTPDSTREDDGIIMVQGLDSLKRKGFLMIFDARDLRVITHVTGTDLVLYGLHNRFYPSHVGSFDPRPTASIPSPPSHSHAARGTGSYVILSLISVFFLIK